MLFSAVAPSSNRTSHAPGGRVIGTGFAAAWLLLWSLCTLAANVTVIVMVAQTLLSWNYSVARGTITHSEIKHDAGVTGKSELADVKYQFRVDGQDFTGSRLSFFNMNWSSPQEAARVVQSLPIGKPVDVFYNPAEPNECGLDRSLDGRPLFLAVLLLPFNLVMIGGWRWAWRNYHGLRNLPMRLEGEQWIVRRSHGSPFVVALIIAGAIDLSVIFLLGSSDLYARIGVMSFVWLFLIGVTGLAYWHTWFSARSEPPVLIADDATRTVSWPTANAESSDLTVAAAQLRAVTLDEAITTAADGKTDLSFSVWLTFIGDDGQPTTRLVLKTNDGHEAETLADWLDDWSGLGQRQQAIDGLMPSSTTE